MRDVRAISNFQMHTFAVIMQIRIYPMSIVFQGSGDVKYQLANRAVASSAGVCVERVNRQTQRKVKISVVANPSHLEGGFFKFLDFGPTMVTVIPPGSHALRLGIKKIKKSQYFTEAPPRHY